MIGERALCVALHWRKSSKSAGTGECVEIAVADQSVLARDSKDLEGPAIEYSPEAWSAFLEEVKATSLVQPCRSRAAAGSPGAGRDFSKL